MSNRFEITGMGAQGDGVAQASDGQVFIPFVLPGEIVTASRHGARAELIAVSRASAERVEPACAHFETCGGCQLQHWQRNAYDAWKRERLVEPLKGRGIDVDVAPLVLCPTASRRRVTLSARRTADGLLLGFNQAHSNTIVPITMCTVADPRIVAALDSLRKLSGMIASTSKAFHLTVTATDSGLDIAASGQGRVDDAARQRAAAFAIEAGFARVSVDGEIVIEPKKPQVMFGTVMVNPPPGAFLQAVPAIEDAMVDEVLAHVGKAKKVLDLFAGCGTFALRLAARSTVHAVESDAASLAALDRGFRQAEGLRTVTVERRDLFQRPLLPRELIGQDAVVFDPPRSGAEAQCRQLARSDVPKVAAVSCNPVTLARDLAILIEGGYRLKKVVPFDQFLFTPHVEAVALLEKPRKRR